MNFKEWLLSEEIFPNKTATVYHRTCQDCNKDESVKAVSSILTKDYKVGKGCYYGCGLYTTFAIESQFTNYMRTYGKAVVKFKVTDLDKYLIFQLSVAKQIHGEDYKISSQFKKLGLLNKVNEIKLKEYDEKQEKENYSSGLAKEFYEQNKWIEKSVKGIIYYGKNDGYCLVKYPTVQDGTITMWGYAVAEPNDTKKMEELKSNIGWIKSVGVLGTPIKNVYKSPIKNKERFAFGDYSYIVDQLLNSKNLEVTAKELRSHLNKLSDENFSNLLKKATNKDQMAEVIIKYKKELTDQNVSSLLYVVSRSPDNWSSTRKNKDEIAKLIIKKKPNLSSENVRVLLSYANDIDEIAKLIQEKEDNISKLSDDDVSNLSYNEDPEKIAKIIIKYKSELTDSNVYRLLASTIDKDEIAGLLGEKNISKLSDHHVKNLLYYVDEDDKKRDKEYTDKMVKIIINYKTELTDDNVGWLLSATSQIENDIDEILELIIKKQSELSDDNVLNLLHYTNDKYKMAEIIINKNPKLSDDSLYYLLDKANDKDKTAELIINKKPEITSSNVYYLLMKANNKDKIAELIIEKKPELSNMDVYNLLYHVTKKDKIAELLQKETDNISKLTYDNVHDLLHSEKNVKQIAQIINKYHTKKTPEIQELIDKYLQPQTIAAK